MAEAMGSRDGVGSGDNDKPYTFGLKPRSAAPFPFTERQFARLLVLRSSRVTSYIPDEVIPVD